MKDVKNLKITKKCIAALMAIVAGGYAIYYSSHHKKGDDYDNGVDSVSVVQNDDQLEMNTETKNISEENNEYQADKFGKIRLLEQYAHMSPMELDEFIKKYSEYALLDYDHAVEILNKNVHEIDKNYATFKEGMVCTLFDKSLEEGSLSITCSNDQVQKRYQEFPNSDTDYEQLELKKQQRKKQEVIMMDICDDLGMNSVDKTITLAIFRLEADGGASIRCVEENNYGGNRLANLEFCSFNTPEFGMYYMISNIKYGYLDEIRKAGNTDPYAIISNMGRYCETPVEWISVVSEIYNDVNSEYNLVSEEEKSLV